MPDQLLHLSLRSPVRRALTVLPLLLALVGAWFSARWFIGNTIAENLNPDDRGVETAQMAVRMAPHDPLTHWTLAEVEQKNLSLAQPTAGITEYEESVRLAPNDYRFWLALGRALEQSGDSQKGERAMRRAVELAPAYSFPRWYLGNLLLRSGNEAEAFDELRRASQADPALRPQVFNLIWEVYGKDPAGLNKAIGSVPEARAEFAKYLIERKQVDVGVSLWHELSVAEKQTNRAVGEALIKSMIELQRFPQALEIWNDLAPDESGRGKVGQMLDGGFEQTLNEPGASVFGWQIKSGQQAQASADRVGPHGGARSLRLLFKARSSVDFNVGQLVVVEPGTQYDFTCYVKTNKLESAGLPIVEILDATNGSVIASSQPAPGGTNDWQRIAFALKTGAKTEAVIIRINRASCGDNSVCPIFGTAWYDDFDLKRRS
jgi:tetratricopeptide (TPR) repeat protein